MGELTEDSFIQYGVPKHDIESVNLEPLKSFIQRISRSERLTLAVQGKLYICTYGYETDRREAFQIPAIRRWAKAARTEIKNWYLCARTEPIPATLIWIAASTLKVNSKPGKMPNGRMGYKITGDAKQLVLFMTECFIGLNEATDKWGWPVKYNYDISMKIQAELFPGLPIPPLDEARS